MKKYYPQNSSSRVGESYYKGMNAEQRRSVKIPSPETKSNVIDGFDLNDPWDFAFYCAAQQLKKENEKKQKENEEKPSSRQSSEYPLPSQS